MFEEITRPPKSAKGTKTQRHNDKLTSVMSTRSANFIGNSRSKRGMYNLKAVRSTNNNKHNLGVYIQLKNDLGNRHETAH